MKRLAGYPRWFFAALMTAMAGVLCTGIALLPSMLEMRLDIAMTWRIGGDLRLLAAASHCAAGFVLVGVLGALLAIHVRIGWRRGLNRISGTALLVLTMVLLLSVLGIYYLGDERLSRASSVIHTSAGLLTVLVVVWHSIRGRRLRRARAVWKSNDSLSGLHLAAQRQYVQGELR